MEDSLSGGVWMREERAAAAPVAARLSDSFFATSAYCHVVLRSSLALFLFGRRVVPISSAVVRSRRALLFVSGCVRRCCCRRRRRCRVSVNDDDDDDVNVGRG